MRIKTFSLLMVCAFLLFSCKNSKKAAQSVKPVVTERPEISNVQTVVAEVEEVAEEIPMDVTVRTESVKPVVPERTLFRYYVIIGSFSNFDNARRYNIDLVNKGFEPEVLESESGLFRVSVGGYDVENAARARIAEIRRNFREHRDVWLLMRK